MISPESRSTEWIKECASRLGVHDIALVEKTIRAFSLLEALARSGCPFLFKGGSSLMLHLNTSRRLSIDIDIICPPGTKDLSITRQTFQRFAAVELQYRHLDPSDLKQVLDDIYNACLYAFDDAKRHLVAAAATFFLHIIQRKLPYR